MEAGTSTSFRAKEERAGRFKFLTYPKMKVAEHMELPSLTSNLTSATAGRCSLTAMKKTKWRGNS